MIKTLIIEDEQSSYALLKTLIEKHFGHELELIGHATSIQNGIERIVELEPDLLFLDIQLDDGDGFRILDHFGDKTNFEVIFTTGLSDYKEKAMDYFAFYYLKKPIDELCFKKVLNRFLTKQSNFDNNNYHAFRSQISGAQRKISLPTLNGNFELIAIDDIAYCEADGSYTHFFTSEGKEYVASSNLKKIEDLLEGTSFFRIHRSILVNLKHIIRYSSSGEIKLSNNKTLLVSSRNKKNFLRVIKLMSYTLN